MKNILNFILLNFRIQNGSLKNRERTLKPVFQNKEQQRKNLNWFYIVNFL